ncbi:phosphocholine-specific phospholipase C [Bryobacter aggregatus]|uniref:phosphocholine-specific phospholipase C n=1 Tax=Bryobacter aggregatus TaxID=360054 RepID=UPI0004E1826B|nr:phospholipase C, phosphocholine-specific [Bryobacter aggregatus]
MSTRRDFLQRAALFAGGAVLTDSLMATLQAASAIEADQGSSYLDAEHVVILMQENRSFDHSYGHLRGVRGFNDPRGVTLPDQKPVWLQSNAAGETYAPFRLDIRETKITWLGSLPHGWPDQSGARNHGNQDGWLEHKKSGRKECAGMPLTLGYYQREDLPFYYALADAFTICDQYFCSSLTGTTPNRLYLWTGTVREEQNDRCKANVFNSDVDYGVEAKWTTFPERLEDAGISWKIYQNELSIASGLSSEDADWVANFTDNPIEWFEQYNVGYHATHRAYLDQIAPALPGEIAAMEKELATLAPNSSEAARVRKLLRQKKWFLAQHEKFSPEAAKQLSARSRALHAKAFSTNAADPHYREVATYRYQDGNEQREMKIPKGDVLHQFRQDVKQGQLPAVSWIVSPENFSDHAGAPWYGAWYLAEVMKILTENPEVWKKTIFILTYDENDGYFDHVAPFVAPDPKRPETGKTSPGAEGSVEYAQPGTTTQPGPIGMGFRVPFVVASPWSRGGYVNSQVFDHTSVLQLLEKILSHRTKREIREKNISPWRRAVCGDLSSVFRPSHGEAQQPLPSPPREEVFAKIHRAQFKKMPAGFRRLGAEDLAQFEKDRFSAEWMPRQEPGVRPATALPYELYASGALTSDGKGFAIRMEAKKDAFGVAASGSGFHVYTPKSYRGDATLRSRAYAVAAGETVADVWDLAGFADGGYDLRICGPNGFLRSFTGDLRDPQLEIEVRYARGKGKQLSGNVELVLNNRGTSAQSIVVRDLAYGAKEQQLRLAAGAARTLLLHLEKSQRWYDLSVTVAGAARYRRHFAGRVENGKPSMSDPQMGRVNA